MCGGERMKRLLLIFLLLIIFGCENVQEKEYNIMAKGKRILIVIAPRNFRDEELFIPYEYFKSRGFDVTVASTKKGEAVGMLGKRFYVNKTLDEINPKDYHAIVIVGGIGSKQYLWDNNKLINLIKEFHNQNKIIAAICLSPAILAKAKIVNGIKVTVFPDSEAIRIIKENNGVYEKKDLVVDKNIITASNPSVAKRFAIEIEKKIYNS